MVVEGGTGAASGRYMRVCRCGLNSTRRSTHASKRAENAGAACKRCYHGCQKVASKYLRRWCSCKMAVVGEVPGGERAKQQSPALRTPNTTPWSTHACRSAAKAGAGCKRSYHGCHEVVVKYLRGWWSKKGVCSGAAPYRKAAPRAQHHHNQQSQPPINALLPFQQAKQPARALPAAARARRRHAASLHTLLPSGPPTTPTTFYLLYKSITEINISPMYSLNSLGSAVQPPPLDFDSTTQKLTVRSRQVSTPC
jgi:hypothetical protein